MVKKSFWLEDAQAENIEEAARKLQVTESAVIRGLLAKKVLWPKEKKAD